MSQSSLGVQGPCAGASPRSLQGGLAPDRPEPQVEGRACSLPSAGPSPCRLAPKVPVGSRAVPFPQGGLAVRAALSGGVSCPLRQVGLGQPAASSGPAGPSRRQQDAVRGDRHPRGPAQSQGRAGCLQGGAPAPAVCTGPGVLLPHPPREGPGAARSQGQRPQPRKCRAWPISPQAAALAAWRCPQAVTDCHTALLATCSHGAGGPVFIFDLRSRVWSRQASLHKSKRSI